MLWMMWGVIQILKEAYKEGPMWLIGCILIPIVLALFIVKNPERARAGRNTILKGFAPLVLGLILMVATSSKKSEAVVKPAEMAPPVAAAPAPVPAPAVAPPAAGAKAVPVTKAVAPAPVVAAPVAPAAPAADPNAGYPALAAACRNEIGLYCASARKSIKGVKACLEDYRDNLLPECKAALRE